MKEMIGNTSFIPKERIINKMYWIREQRVMFDVDLAELYEVPTKRLNEQVRRNKERFPEDFMFQLHAPLQPTPPSKSDARNRRTLGGHGSGGLIA